MSRSKQLIKTWENREFTTELDFFLKKVQEAQISLDSATKKVRELYNLEDQELKDEAHRLEKLIESARSYTFKIL